MENFKKKLFDFLDNSKTSYHAVENVCKILDASGYTKLYENEKWQLENGGKYYVTRNGSSVIAFRNNGGGFMMGASHSDFPGFRVKGEIKSGVYLKLDCEKYGGLINYTWLDRPLTVSGRVVVRTSEGFAVRLVDIGEKSVVIPSLAIHLNRNVNESLKLNPAQDLLPLASIGIDSGEIFNIICASLGCNAEDIVSHELFLTNSQQPMTIGLKDELVLSPRLDDLLCVYSSLDGFIASSDSGATPVLAVFDNEEVGSSTKQGAASTFLYDTLRRICADDEEYLMRVASSFMISADNAHAIHPNHPEMADKNNAPTLGAGVVIKYNANQKYATDAVSEALFREICKKAGVKVQTYYNRADLPGGSTLGSISDTNVSVPTVDIGVPQLAMHSAVETCALSDAFDMATLFKKFYSECVSFDKEKIVF